MRAGPLSRTSVIELLNKHFVPVYVSTEDVVDDGPASPEEKEAYRHVFRAAGQANLSVGTVHAYILSPEGEPVDSQHVAEAARGDNLQGMLERAIQRFQIPAGEPLVKPAVQSAGFLKPNPDGLTLHLTSRAEGTDPSDTSWHAYPSEDWILLDKAEAPKLLPPAGTDVKAGASWEIDKDVAAKMLRHFYPQTENNDVTKNKIERQSLKATVVSVDEAAGTARARVDGDLRMQHSFYHKDDGKVVEAKVLGFIDFEPAAGKLKRFRLVTSEATYMNRKFDVAVKSIP